MINTNPIPLYGDRFQTDPVGLYREMRETHGPVVPILLAGNVPAWLVIGYRELHQVATNSDVFARSTRHWNAWGRVPEGWPMTPIINQIPSILYSDGEEHRRRARAISAALEAVDRHELRTVTTRMADRLVDGFCTSTGADLRQVYTSRLAGLVVGWTFGLDDAEGERLSSLITALVDADEDSAKAQGETFALLSELAASRAARPGHDVPSRMFAHPAGYTPQEIVEDLLVVLAAATQNVGEWLGNSLRLVLTDDRFAASVFGARSSVREALNEVLWEDTPCQVQPARFPTQDVELGGKLLRRGDMVLLGLAGANHDRQVHQGAAASHGGNHAHLSFSRGEHGCPYPAQEIAEIITTVGVEVLMDRLPDIELAVAPDEVRWRHSPWMRGVVSLPVHFSPAPRMGEV
nr:cytochrome P450 [Nocardiopsis sp. CT-R113]